MAPVPMPKTWEQDMQRISQIDNATMLLYEQQFGAEVFRVVEDLKKHGLADATLEQTYKDPHNVLGIRIIARHLAAEAERISPEGIKPLIIMEPL
jgi:hypothetical protein